MIIAQFTSKAISSISFLYTVVESVKDEAGGQHQLTGHMRLTTFRRL